MARPLHDSTGEPGLLTVGLCDRGRGVTNFAAAADARRTVAELSAAWLKRWDLTVDRAPYLSPTKPSFRGCHVPSRLRGS